MKKRTIDKITGTISDWAGYNFDYCKNFNHNQ